MKGEPRIEYMPLSKIKRARRNPKKHELKTLNESVDRFGFVQPLLLNEKDKHLVAGHGRLDLLQQMKDKGMAPPERVQRQNGEWLVPVIRGIAFKDSKEAEAYLLADNKLVEAGGWDDLALTDILADLAANTEKALQGIGYPKDDLKRLMDIHHPIEVEEVPAQMDRADELQEKWKVQLGQIWKVGRHRVMCGDTSDCSLLFADEKYSLLVTDPPYGVSYAAKNEFLNNLDKGNRVQTAIDGDHRTPEEMSEFWKRTFSELRKYASPGASYYVTGPQGGDLLLLLLALRESEFPLRHMLIWSKNNHVLGRSDYHYKHEPIIYGWVKGGHKFYGGHSEVSVWSVDKPLKSEFHPTTKPVELFTKAIANSSKTNDIVCDGFLGSGTTMVAAEQLDRICYGMEIEPRYVAVTLERMESMGLKPELQP